MRNKDLEDALAFAARLHACQDPSELRRVTVRGLSELIGAERVTFEHFAPTVPRLWAVADPDDPYLPWMWETFLTHLHEHPVIKHYRATGDLGANKISDFVSTREWRRTELYQRLYRPLGYEDQMGVCLAPPGREFYSVVLSRGRRSFSERDRGLLTLLRPHFAQAHANALAFERLQRENDRRQEATNWLTQSAILLDELGRVLHCPPRARLWLRRYFGENFQRNLLPARLDAWVRRQLFNRGLPAKPAFPLIREREGSRLILRLRAAPEENRFAIIAEELSAPAPSTLRTLGLTRRQLEILLEVEKGKSNDEIAAALFISPLTVRKHLENIFDALGVTNRTAAVSRLRELV